MFRSSNFEKSLDKATSPLLLDPDWVAILQVCDLVRQKDCQPKQAVASITKRLTNENPHIAFYSLLVLESIVKNCGALVYDEVGTRSFMEQLREIYKSSPHENVKTKILELLQAWAHAFRNQPKYRAVQDTVTIMKAEGYKFPPLTVSDAMFMADTAPEWKEGEVCNRCRTSFSLINRKHHCRACGEVFCASCSSKSSILPKFGIEKEVRVCETCYASINNRSTPAATVKAETDLPPEYVNSSLAQQSQTASRTEQDLQEEEELQLAIALSQSEAEEKEKKLKNKSPRHTSLNNHLSTVASETPVHVEDDPELARYLDRSYWDQRNKEESNKAPSAPSHTAASTQSNNQTSRQTPVTTTVNNNHSGTATTVAVNNKLQQNGDAEDNEIDEFVNTLKTQVEIFVNRMKSNSSRGRSIANDSSVQTLFLNITAMHSTLLRFIQQQDDKRVYYEGLQDKLAQVKDARAALDALRFEHQEKLRHRAEEAERLRQMQMAQKLDIMRQKKQEYLQYQRQLALQRVQEQEREMQMRQEQQKQQYLMSGVPYNRFMPPGVVPPGNMPMMPPTSMGPYPPPGMFPHPQSGHPPFMGYQPPYAGHVPQGMMPPNMIGGPHPVHMGLGPIGHPGPAPPQPGSMPPQGPHPGQMGPQAGPMGHSASQPGQMPPPGSQPGPMPPGGTNPGQMPPSGPPPAPGPHPVQMGLPGPPTGPHPGQVNQMGAVSQMPPMGGMPMPGIPVSGAQDVRNEELISFD